MLKDVLSKMPIYDFGLRKILSLLRAIGKAWTPSSSLGDMGRLMHDNFPEITQEDKAAFSGVIAILFPPDASSMAGSAEDEAMRELKDHVAQSGLHPSPKWLACVQSIESVASRRHALLLVGPAGPCRRVVSNPVLTAAISL